MKRTLGVALAGILGLAAPQRPVLLWNTTASVPLGFYRLQREPPPRVGDLVAVRPPAKLAVWLAVGGYVPVGVPLMKRIAASGPSVACRTGLTVTVDGALVGLALPRGRRGERLPQWSGCARLRADQVFLISPMPGSLDSRYFGPVPRSGVIGRAVPLWLAPPQ
jgi:conjugative transfer signal peptidase TraF